MYCVFVGIAGGETDGASSPACAVGRANADGGKSGKNGAGDVEDVRARRGASKVGKMGGDEALEDAPMQIRTLLFPPDCRAADSLVGPLVEPAVEFVVSVGLRQLVTIR